MNSITKTSLLLLGFVLLLTGCASSNPKSTAFIPNPKILKESAKDSDTLYFLDKKVDLSLYNNIVIHPIQIVDNDEENKLNSELSKKISTYFQNKLSLDFNKVLQNNNKIKKDLELYVSINAIDVSYNDLKFYQYLPYGLAFTALKRGSGFEGKKLRVALALKLKDKQTSQTIAIVVDKKVGEDVQNKEVLTLNDVRPLLDTWSERFSTRLDELRDGKYKDQLK